MIKLNEIAQQIVKKQLVTEHLQYHIDNKISILENVFRGGSGASQALIIETRKHFDTGIIQLNGADKHVFETTDIGRIAKFKNETVVLDLPFIAEAEYQGREVPIGKPKRGGSKKFYVYVKNPKTGKVKKISFGDTSGLSAKINDPAARKSFAARHKCSTKKDRTKAGYWACRLPRYAKLLGLKGSYSGYW
jgi:hypothetical protein